MKKVIYNLYFIYLFLTVFACIYLAIVFGFGIEYVLLGAQATIVNYFLIRYKPFSATSENLPKSEFSLFVAVLFIGIIYYATLHILVIAMSGIVVAGWFLLMPSTEKDQ